MRAFLEELRRRGVSRAAAVYAVAAWAVIEVSATVLPALHLPEWTVTLIVVLALLGFPVALVTAWVFDLTRAGIVRTPKLESLPAGQADSRPRGRVVELLIIALLLGVVGWLGWERLQRPSEAGLASTQADRLDSIAVLPFANLSGDPENEYFGDGLAEELLNVLVRIEGLRVTARTSSFQYKGRNLDIREIARDLGVSSVLEGSVRKAGERVRITAQLIRAADGFHLWSQTFDRELADIFAVQDEISGAIAAALRATLDTSPPHTHPPTRNVAAFEAYLRGRFAMNQRTGASLEQAIADFRNAVTIDPDYAAAYSGLADSYLLSASYGDLGTTEAIRMAEPMVERALRLDPQLAEAHASRGLLLRDQGDTLQSIDALRRAVELNPSYSPAQHWLALSYQDLGRLRDARQTLEGSLKVDPNYVTGKRVLLGLMRVTGDHAQADSYAAELAREHGGDPLVLYTLAGDAYGRNQLVQATRHSAAALRLQPDAAFIRSQAASILATAGDLERAEKQWSLAAQLAPGNDMYRLWPLQLATFRGDHAYISEHLDALLAGMADSMQRAIYGCNFSTATADPRRIEQACEALLLRLRWQPGVPLPGELGDRATALIAAHLSLGNHERAQQLRAAAIGNLKILRDQGLAAIQLQLFEHWLDLLGGGDPAAMLELMEQWVVHTPIPPLILRSDPSFAGVQGLPRFEALLSSMQRRHEDMLQEIRTVEIP